MGTKGKRRIKLWHVAVSIPVVCAVGGFAVSAIIQRNSQAEVDREVAKLRSLGVPTEPKDFERAVAPQDNAGPFYTRAIASYQATPEPKSIYDFAKPPAKAVVEGYLRDQQRTFELLAEATERKDCYFPRKWADGPFILFPEYAGMKNFAKLLQLRANEEAARGDFRAAIDTFRTSRKVAEHLREPVLIATLVSIAVEAIAHAGFQKQLATYGSNPAFLNEAKRFVEDYGALPSVRTGMKGEVLGIRTTLQLIGNGRGGSLGDWEDQGYYDSSSRPMFYALRIPGIRAAVEASALRMHRKAFETMKEGDYNSEIEASAKMDRDMMADQTLIGKITSWFFPVFAQSGVAVARVEAQRRISRAAVSIWEDRARTGTFPAAYMKELDPFTDLPLVYKKTQTGFKLYSVGPNKNDDEGMAKTGSPRTDDIELRW